MDGKIDTWACECARWAFGWVYDYVRGRFIPFIQLNCPYQGWSIGHAMGDFDIEGRFGEG
jgi:hypothetical protein